MLFLVPSDVPSEIPSFASSLDPSEIPYMVPCSGLGNDLQRFHEMPTVILRYDSSKTPSDPSMSPKTVPVSAPSNILSGYPSCIPS